MFEENIDIEIMLSPKSINSDGFKRNQAKGKEIKTTKKSAGKSLLALLS